MSYWRRSLRLELLNRHADRAELLVQHVDRLLVLLVGRARLVAVLLHPPELDLYRGVRDAAVLVVLLGDALEDRVERVDLVLYLDEGFFRVVLEVRLHLRHAHDAAARLLQITFDEVLELHELDPEALEHLLDGLEALLHLLRRDVVLDGGEDVAVLGEVLVDGVNVPGDVVGEGLQRVVVVLELLHDERPKLLEAVAGHLRIIIWGPCSSAGRRVQRMLHDAALRHRRDEAVRRARDARIGAER